MQRIYIPVWYFRSSPVNFVRCSIYTCVCRLTHLRSHREDMVRNIINRPDGLINRLDDLLICPNDLLIRPDRLINHSDNLLIRLNRLIIIHPDELINRPDDFLICPDGLINCADDLLIRPDDLLHYAPCPLGGFVHTGPSQVNNFVSGSCCTLWCSREEEGRGKYVKRRSIGYFKSGVSGQSGAVCRQVQCNHKTQ